jgi:hypothetical protein
LSVVVKNPIGHGVLVELAILVTGSFDDRIMPHVKDRSDFSPWWCELHEPLILHKRVISRLYLSGPAIEDSFPLPLLKLGLRLEGRVVYVVSFSKD